MRTVLLVIAAALAAGVASDAGAETGPGAQELRLVLASERAEHAERAGAFRGQLRRERTLAARLRAQLARERKRRARGPRVPAWWLAAARRVAACESGGDPRAVSPGGRYRGLLQFDLRTWRSVGGSGDPAAAAEREQLERAYALWQRRGWSPWPACSVAVGLR